MNKSYISMLMIIIATYTSITMSSEDTENNQLLHLAHSLHYFQPKGKVVNLKQRTSHNATTAAQANEIFDNITQGNKSYQSAIKSYQYLNRTGHQFNMGPGIGLSQTIYNTAPTIYNPHVLNPFLGFILKANPISSTGFMSSIAHYKLKLSPFKWLKGQEWYALTCIPKIACKNPACNKTVDFYNVNKLTEKERNILLESILDNLHNENQTSNYESQNPQIYASVCPYCMSDNVKLLPQTYVGLDKEHQQAIVEQIDYLGVQEQPKTLPTCRLSIEPADILQDGSKDIDPAKLYNLAQFINELGNPLLFMHHYANPAVDLHLFESDDDIEWFANLCAEVIKLCPQVTHVCPISQPLGFAQKINNAMQPPYYVKVPFQKFLHNITEAQKQASIQMKAINPHLQVLLSHQWKPMKQLHTNSWDPRSYGLEPFVVKKADASYNQAFVQAFANQTDHFDGIALSVYPALYFNMVIPAGDNCSGALDPHASLEAITQTYKAFNKPIYVVETGCNCPDAQRKKDFVDMILQVCAMASAMNIPVKTCFFWGLTNDINFYREWNKAPGSTHFGFYNDLNPQNPIGSITPYGKYFRNIIYSNFSPTEEKSSYKIPGYNIFN